MDQRYGNVEKLLQHLEPNSLAHQLCSVREVPVGVHRVHRGRRAVRVLVDKHDGRFFVLGPPLACRRELPNSAPLRHVVSRW